MSLDDIEIKTPFGEIILPSEDLYDFLKFINSESRKEADLRHKHIYEFFEPIKPDNEFFAIKPHKVPSYLKSFWEVLNRDFDILQIKDYDGKMQFEVPVSCQEVEVALDVKESLPLNATVFVKSKKTGEKYVFSLIPYSDGDGHHLEVESFFDSSRASFREVWNSVEEYFQTKGPLKESKFDTRWKFIHYEERDWDSIVMDSKTRKLINRNIINFIKNLDEYKDKRLPTSRGVLITGPPGTGKTLCCETIMNMVDCTTIYVTSDSVEQVGDIKSVYKLARKLSPTIVVIEDIDTLGGLDRREKGYHPLLGEFLNCLNGVGNNEGVITIATTNYPEHLDIAISDRPGRFDLRIEFGVPDKDLRKHILEKYLEEVEYGKLNFPKLIKETDGFTGAYLREVVVSAYMISLENNSVITQEIMDEALESVLNMRKNVLSGRGYKKFEEGIYS